MALFPWRKKKNDSIHLTHGGLADPAQPTPVNDPVTAFGPPGDTPSDPVNMHTVHGGLADPTPTNSGPVVSLGGTGGGDTPSDPARIMNPGVGGTSDSALNNIDHHQHDQHWWASHYPHTIHDADGGPRPRDNMNQYGVQGGTNDTDPTGPRPRDDMTKATPIQVNVSDGTENKPAGVSLGGESISVSSGVTDPTQPDKDGLKPWGGEAMPNDAMGLSPHPEDKG